MNNILPRRTAALVCITIAAGLFVAGLWPFSFQAANNVKWLMDRNGLQFEPDGVAYDPVSLPGATAAGSLDRPATFTLELWLEPGMEPNTDVFHILTIDDGQLPSNFVLCQWKSELLLRSPDNGNKRGFREVGVDVLQKRKARFIVVAGDASGTAFYADGIPVERFPDFVLPVRRLNGRLILGNAAEGKHPWTGRLFGLAMFDRALDPGEVVQHHTDWTNHRAEHLMHEPGLTALYLFDQRYGRWADDSSPAGHRLFIPPRYEVLHKLVLTLPRYDDSLSQPNLGDIATNILGFVPFGFCIFYSRRRIAPERPLGNALLAVLGGAGLSLTIELIQVWLPNRSSSAADLACNTLGTVLGAVLGLLVRSPTTTPDTRIS